MLEQKDYCPVYMVFLIVVGFIDRLRGYTNYLKKTRVHVMYRSSVSRVRSTIWRRG